MRKSSILFAVFCASTILFSSCAPPPTATVPSELGDNSESSGPDTRTGDNRADPLDVERNQYLESTSEKALDRHADDPDTNDNGAKLRRLESEQTLQEPASPKTLRAAAEQPNKPKLTVTSPRNKVSSGRVEFEGTFSTDAEVEHRVVYVVDVSGSTSSSGNDCNGNGSVGAEDDLDGDRVAGTVRDCEIAGVVALNASLRRTPVDISLIAFGSSAAIADMSPKDGDQVFAKSTDDKDDNTVADLQDVAASLREGKIGQFSTRSGLGSGTSFELALNKLEELITTASNPTNKSVQYTVFFLSDGEAGYPISVASRLAGLDLEGVRIPILNTVSVGTGAAGCGVSSPLRRISDLFNGWCTESTPAALVATLGSSAPIGLDRIVVKFNGGESSAVVDVLGRWNASFDDVRASKSRLAYTVTAYLLDGSTVVENGEVTVSSKIEYIALGDSYSSGNGLVPYFKEEKDPNGKRCQRSEFAASYFLRFPGPKGSGTPTGKYAHQRDDTDFSLMACGGAVAADMLHKNQFKGVKPQIENLDASTDLVTFTIGGNDAGFSRILQFCGIDAGINDDCQNIAYETLGSGRKLKLKDFAKLRLNLLEIDLSDVYRQVQVAAPNATVLTSDYLYLLPADAEGTCRITKAFSRGERDWVREREDDVSQAIKRAAALSGVHFTSIIDSSSGHENCGKGSGDEWVYGLEVTFKDQDDDADCKQKKTRFYTQTYCILGRSFHPTKTGTKKYGELFSKFLQEAVNNGDQLNAFGLPINPQSKAPQLRAGSGSAPFAGRPASVMTEAASVSAIQTGEPAGTPEERLATSIAELGLTADEVADVKAATYDFAAVSTLTAHGYTPPPARCDSRDGIVKGETVLVQAAGFEPDTPVRASVRMREETFTYDVEDSSEDGAAWAAVQMPQDTPSDSVVGLTLTGTGANGGRRVANALIPIEEAGTECEKALLNAGFISDDEKLLPAVADESWIAIPVRNLRTGLPLTLQQAKANTKTPTSLENNSPAPAVDAPDVTPLSELNNTGTSGVGTRERRQLSRMPITGGFPALMISIGIVLVGSGILVSRLRRFPRFHR